MAANRKSRKTVKHFEGEIHCNVFKYKTMLFAGCHSGIPAQYHYEVAKQNIEGRDTALASFVDPHYGNGGFVWFKDRHPHPSIVAHEALHMAKCVIRMCALFQECEEIQAYLIEHFVREIILALEKKK